MNFDFNSIVGFVPTWLYSPVFWTIFLVILPLMGYLFLLTLKRKKLVYAVMEIVDLGGETKEGNGKININFLGGKSAGYFGSKWKMGGLISYGQPTVMRLKSGEIVEKFNEQCFQEINGRRGIIVYRDPANRVMIPVQGMDIEQTVAKEEKAEGKVEGDAKVYPTSGFRVTNRNVLATLSPQDYSNTSVDIINKRTQETSDKLSAIAQAITLGIIGIVLIIGIIFVINYAAKTTGNAQVIATETIKTCAESMKTVCQEVVSQYAKASAAP